MWHSHSFILLKTHYDTVDIMHELDFWESYETFVADLKNAHKEIDDIFLSNIEITYTQDVDRLQISGVMNVRTSDTYEVCQGFGYQGSFDTIYSLIVLKMMDIVLRIFPEIWNDHG